MGARLPSLQQIATDSATAWETVQVRRYGQTATVQIHRLPCLWYRSHRDRALTILLVRDPSSKEAYQVALISTDLDASSVELVERFACRWSIEVAFEDAKQLAGVGEARNRTEQAVKRTAPFGLLCLSLTVTWYALHGHSPIVSVSSARCFRQEATLCLTAVARARGCEAR